MKISRSLKIYILFAVISMGVITVVSFSTLAVNYFVQGLDASVRQTMEMMAKDINITQGSQQKILDFEVSLAWADTPEMVQKNVEPLTKHLSFEKYVFRDHWWDVPSNVVFVLRYDRENNQTAYISRVMEPKALIADKEQGGHSHIVKIIYYAIGGITIFSLILLLLFRQVAKPIGRLKVWAESLTPEVLQQPTPSFHYSELNYLASIVSSSLQSVQTTLEREKKFLAHASHELRTPIAVVRSNTELMQKLIEKPNSLDKQRIVLERILRAGYGMTELCEILLWLNRGEYLSVPTATIELNVLLEQLTKSLRYLIENKKVEVYTQFEAGKYPMSSSLVTIVVGNLIRNAYQHTQCGRIEIIQKGQKVSISNREAHIDESPHTLGFGLGLELTEQIIRHYNWYYHVEQFSNGRRVDIEFVSKVDS